MRSKLILSPHEYRQVKEIDLNEMRAVAGLASHQVFTEKDNILKDFISKAGL
jgi:hypothetical protein